MSSTATVVHQPGRRVTRSTSRARTQDLGTGDPNLEIGVTASSSHIPNPELSRDPFDRFPKEDIRHYGTDNADTRQTGNSTSRTSSRGYRSANETLTGIPKTRTRKLNRSTQHQSPNDSDSFSETEHYIEDVTLGQDGQEELTKFLDEMNADQAKPTTRPSRPLPTDTKNRIHNYFSKLNQEKNQQDRTCKDTR
jgi:hypothetical protein